MMLLLMAIFLAAALFEYWSLARNKHYREIAVSAVFLVAGLLLGLLRTLQITIPSPLMLIQQVFGPLSDALKNWLS